MEVYEGFLTADSDYYLALLATKTQTVPQHSVIEVVLGVFFSLYKLITSLQICVTKYSNQSADCYEFTGRSCLKRSKVNRSGAARRVPGAFCPVVVGQVWRNVRLRTRSAVGGRAHAQGARVRGGCRQRRRLRNGRGADEGPREGLLLLSHSFGKGERECVIRTFQARFVI